jgi:hypothetical protein
MGSLPIDKVPSEANRQVLVHALVEEFPEAAKAMATVTRVGKQQVSLAHDKQCPTDSQRTLHVTIATSSASTKHMRTMLLFLNVYIDVCTPQARMGISLPQLCTHLKCKPQCNGLTASLFFSYYPFSQNVVTFYFRQARRLGALD